MIKAICTWGEGPDVLIVIEEAIILGEDPKNYDAPRGKYTHGIVESGWMDLTAEQAEKLGHELLKAAGEAKKLEAGYQKNK